MNDPNAGRPGFKETKVGWIPEEWEAKSVGEIAEVSYGLTVNQRRREASRRLPYLTVADFSADGMAPRPAKEIGCLNGDEAAYALQPEDILMVEGNGSREIVGMAALWPGSDATVLHQNHLLRVRVDRSKAEPALVSEVIRSGAFRRRLAPKIITSSGLHTINSRVVSGALLPLPPTREQERIVEILATIDAEIRAVADLIEGREQLKAGLMQTLLSGKMRLPGFNDVWRESTLGELLVEVRRPVDWDDEEEYQLVSVRRRSGGLFYREPQMGRDIQTKTMYTTRAGDFVIARMQVIHGAMAMVTPEFDGGHVSGSYITLVRREGADLYMPFLDYVSRTKWFYHLAYLSSYGVAIEKMTFSLRDFLKKQISIPPTVAEQEAVAEVLQTAEREISALRAKRDALLRQKKALMQKLLTGQVRVKV